MSKIDKAVISAKNKFHNFMADESGISNIVATVLIILMVVVLAGALFGFLSGWFQNMFNKIAEPDYSI